MPKIAVLVVSMYLAIIPLSLSAAEPPRPNGTWWRTLTKDQKVVAVKSLIAGYRMGFFDGSVIQSGNDYKTVGNNKKIYFGTVHRLTFSRSIGTYIVDINTFFEKYPDLRSLDVSNLVICMDRRDYNCGKMAQSIRTNISNFQPTTTPP